MTRLPALALMAAFVDLMNRTRRDHIITIEREINIVHERGSSFISQREVRGSHEEIEARRQAEALWQSLATGSSPCSTY